MGHQLRAARVRPVCSGGLALLLAIGAVAAMASSRARAADKESTGPPPAGLEALVQEAVAGNPDIKAAQRRHEAAVAMVPQARALPDPTINLSYEDMEVDETIYGVSQELPFFGKRDLQGEVATRDAERLEQEYLAIRLGIIARLKQAYYELAFAHQSADIIGDNRQVLIDFAQTAEAGYVVGKMAQADVLRAQAEVSRILARLATLRQQQRSIQAELARLLNRDPGQPLDVPAVIRLVPLRHDLDELLALVDRDAPMLRAEAKRVERGNAAVALARRQYWPDFEVGVMGIRDEPMNVNGYQLMLNVTVPLYAAVKQRYGVREAMAAREEAAGNVQAVRQELAMRVRDNLAQIERAGQLVALLNDAIIPQARLTLESARAGYAVGRVDFLTLLNSLLTLQESELEQRREIVEHEKARARIEEIVGEDP